MLAVKSVTLLSPGHSASWSASQDIPRSVLRKLFISSSAPTACCPFCGVPCMAAESMDRGPMFRRSRPVLLLSHTVTTSSWCSLRLLHSPIREVAKKVEVGRRLRKWLNEGGCPNRLLSRSRVLGTTANVSKTKGRSLFLPGRKPPTVRKPPRKTSRKTGQTQILDDHAHAHAQTEPRTAKPPNVAMCTLLWHL